MYNNVFSNNNDNLDLMARNLNNNRKYLANKTKMGFHNTVQGIDSGMEHLAKYNHFNYQVDKHNVLTEQYDNLAPHPFNPSNPTGFFSVQGEYTFGSPITFQSNSPLELSPYNSPTELSLNNSLSYNTDSMNQDTISNSDRETIPSMADSFSKSIGSDYTSFNNSHSDSHTDMASISDLSTILSPIATINNHSANHACNDIILEHIKHCMECKHQLASIHVNNNKIEKYDNIVTQPALQVAPQLTPHIAPNEPNAGFINNETRDIIIIILLGIFIILLLDIYMKK
jgi:hypothetical protein